MKLWLLRPIDGDAQPWSPWYDKAFGFVVRAETEAKARHFAAYSSDYLVREPEYPDKHDYNEAWLDPSLASCAELTPDGDAGIVIMDFRAA